MFSKVSNTTYPNTQPRQTNMATTIRDEFKSYLKTQEIYGIRTKLSILSLSRKTVYYAVFRGEEVQEFVEYKPTNNPHSRGVNWEEKVDVANHYGWIPPYWRFGNNDPPKRLQITTEQLAEYLLDGDILDVDTLYAIALRRGTKPDYESARECVKNTLTFVSDTLQTLVHAESTKTWPKISDIGVWEQGEWYSDSKNKNGKKHLTNMYAAVLIRVWAEGYDPLETEPPRGGMPTDEQMSWIIVQSEHEQEHNLMFVYRTILSLHKFYFKYFGLPR